MTARVQPPEWSVACPWCHAPPGTRCTSPRGRRISVDSHDARLAAWTTASDQQTGEPE
ncbi:hypothetical protein [Streptomyces sp. V2]|uniref:zinc finger domain-containing protein n=1 Tax=Streptomyces sp. V2 TaxID=1424099 RepID=UPI0014037789|nr:hypothetical protein [Streptomyces sp. V2]